MMKMITFRNMLLLIVLTMGLFTSRAQHIMTVKGSISADQMGKTLIHEHILVDFIGADKINPSRWEKEKVIEKVKPFITELRQMEYVTLVECTPAYLGRDPLLLLEISNQTGLNLLTNTGYYGAVDNKYLPDFALEETAEELSERWVSEWENGIDNTGIRPGFIKISVNPGPLSPLHQKIVKAAALTHLKTGLTIASHTGPYVPAQEQVTLLKEMGVDPSAFIWVHAQGESEIEHLLEMAALGVWISLDGIQENNMETYLMKIQALKNEGLLNKTLISHDAGWYKPDEKKGGDFRPFNTIEKKFIPLLLEKGFSDIEINQLLVTNPRNAFTISIKPLIKQ